MSSKPESLSEDKVPGTSSETILDNLSAESANFLKAIIVGIEITANEKIAPIAVERTTRRERRANSGGLLTALMKGGADEEDSNDDI